MIVVVQERPAPGPRKPEFVFVFEKSSCFFQRRLPSGVMEQTNATMKTSYDDDSLALLTLLEKDRDNRADVPTAPTEEEAEKARRFVLSAERTQYAAPKDRQAIKRQLKEAAELLWRTNKRSSESVVWSAIRRYASMLSRSEVDTLRGFLDWRWPIDTRQVTLQAIQNVFEISPPSAGNEYQQLRNQVFQMAQAALQPATLAPGKPAALAMNAVAAVAALGDPRLPECVQAVRAWDRPWFARQVRQVLREFTSDWPSDDPATVQVTEAMNALAAG
jgi:hypothetical protein